jgi:hypothetical protein
LENIEIGNNDGKYADRKTLLVNVVEEGCRVLLDKYMWKDKGLGNIVTENKKLFWGDRGQARFRYLEIPKMLKC